MSENDQQQGAEITTKSIKVKGYIKKIHPGVMCVTISNCVKHESGTNV